MKRFVALLYHSLSERPTSEYQVTPEDLRQQLRSLVEAGFVVEGLGGLADRLADGGELPDRYVLATFDDGHRSNLEAAEIVRDAGASATFFVSVGHSREHADYLQPGDIADLGDIAEVGSHAVTHRYLHRLPLDELRTELAESRDWIADIVGRPVDLLSLPGGGGNRTVHREAAAAGYRLVGTSTARWNTRASAARGAVGRVMVTPRWGPAHLRAVAECRPRAVAPRWARSLASDALRRVVPARALMRLSRATRRPRSGD